MADNTLKAGEDYDYEVEPRPDKNCKDCNGKGWYNVVIDKESGPQQRACHCIKYVRVGPEQNRRLPHDTP